MRIKVTNGEQRRKDTLDMCIHIKTFLREFTFSADPLEHYFMSSQDVFVTYLRTAYVDRSVEG